MTQGYIDSDIPSEQQTLLTAIIKAVTEWAEDYRCERFITQTWDYFLDRLPYREFQLPYGPLQSITSITYIDTAGNTQTLSSTLYLVDIYSYVPRIYPAYASVWPAIRDIQNSVTIRAVQGYGAASAVPDHIIHALKLIALHFYERRTPLEDIQTARVPLNLKALLDMNRKSWL